MRAEISPQGLQTMQDLTHIAAKMKEETRIEQTFNIPKICFQDPLFPSAQSQMASDADDKPGTGKQGADRAERKPDDALYRRIK